MKDKNNKSTNKKDTKKNDSARDRCRPKAKTQSPPISCGSSKDSPGGSRALNQNTTLAKAGFMKTMFKGLIIFGVGLYTGVYIAQNYQIDKVEDPKVLFGKLQAYIKEKTDSGKK